MSVDVQEKSWPYVKDERKPNQIRLDRMIAQNVTVIEQNKRQIELLEKLVNNLATVGQALITINETKKPKKSVDKV